MKNEKKNKKYSSEYVRGYNDSLKSIPKRSNHPDYFRGHDDAVIDVHAIIAGEV